jgi:hypothetical protein
MRYTRHEGSQIYFFKQNVKQLYIALVTVSFQCIKAALTNPVKSLRGK